MTYQRVIPRDLFNEANLLKCVGKLALLHHDGLLPFEMDYDDEPFIIEQSDCGHFFIDNISFYTPGYDPLPVRVGVPVNSRRPWPLTYGLTCGYVFTEAGKFDSDAFKKELEALSDV